jgi:hypothetical protein
MNKNIINKYIKILLIIINNVDPVYKYIGRPIIYKYKYCLKIIFDMLFTGISWKTMEKLKKIKIDAIRKRFNKWVLLNIFDKAYNILFQIYKKKYNIKNLYIDSTVISNTSGSLKFGYNIKIKNKKSIKITAIVDDNKIPHLLKVTSSNPHDAKIMEDILNENNIKNINLIGDKGYIKSDIYVDKINKEFNINLITPNRINSVNKNLLNNEYKKYLKKRYIVENFFCLLKKTYKRINIINDKLIHNYNNFLYLTKGLIISQYI